MKTTYITNKDGKTISVVLSVKQYQKLYAAYEELEDIRLYDAVKARKEDRITLEEYLKQRKKKKNT